ncbi:MAG: hypothetical protein A2046_08225 [Bacteroidetes bacterium GWA2_30_7]|nr:MAG: hypothetical protein A2046_08225 [Bacteroidetes bacterium GWA2_30_7]
MFWKNITYSILIILALSIFSSCSEYQKILKSTDYKRKYDKAIELYEKEDYFRAHSLFEELLSIYKGTEKGEEIYYYYANCYYGEGDFMMAGYYFKNYSLTYPIGKHKEECNYMAAYCAYLNSPEPTLDQAYTYKAIDEFQLFINRYPKSERITKCNEMIDKLRSKLETKSYLNSKLYFDIGEYKAAIQSLKGSLKGFPDTEYREELLYLIVKANYLLAQKSVEIKKKERYQTTVTEYYALIAEFPESRYKKEAERIFENSKNELN